MQLLIIFWSELILVSGKLETRTLTECKISQKLPNRDSCDYHAHQKAWSLTHDHSSCQVWWRPGLKCDLERWPTTKLAKNYPTVTAVITRPWRPSIGMVTDPWPFIMSSLVKIRPKMRPRMCANHKFSQKLPNCDSCDYKTVKATIPILPLSF